jgi:hypothetical protein
MVISVAIIAGGLLMIVVARDEMGVGAWILGGAIVLAGGVTLAFAIRVFRRVA